MPNKSLLIAMTAVPVCFVVLTAWLYTENHKTASIAEQTQTDLDAVTAQLQETSAQKDKIQSTLQSTSTEKDLLQSNLDSTSIALDQEKTKAVDLQNRINTLQAKIDQLNDQLKEKAEEEINSKLYGIVLTTKVNKRHRPEISLEKISINEQLLYIFAKWRLSLKTHHYTVKIFDGSEELIFEKKYTTKPDEPTWNTWPGYYINKYTDKPGLWKVELYLDGRKVGEKSITVTTEPKSSSNATQLKNKFPETAENETIIECEKLEISNKTIKMDTNPQDMYDWPKYRWSGNQHLLVMGKNKGDFIELRFKAKNNLPQKITLYATKSWDFGILRFSVNGKTVAKDFDAYSPKVKPAKPIELGVFEPQEGFFILRVEVVGANPAAERSKSFFGLDCIKLSPVSPQT